MLMKYTPSMEIGLLMALKKIKLKDIIMNDGVPFNFDHLGSYENYDCLLKNLKEVYWRYHKSDKDVIFLLQGLRIYYFLSKMLRGEKFPPIAIKDGRLKDGIHRLFAHYLAGHEEVECDVRGSP